MFIARTIILTCVLLWNKLHNLFWKTRVRIQVFLLDGKLSLDRSVKFHYAVFFQGKGKLTLEPGVILGFPMAGALNAPILLQPREKDAHIRIGSGSIIVNGCEFIARSQIIIGTHCRIGPRCIFLDSDFHGIKPDARDEPGATSPIIVGDNVWFGAETMVLKGVKIGSDSIIAARCVVTKDVPAGSIVASNPMIVIGSVYD